MRRSSTRMRLDLALHYSPISSRSKTPKTEERQFGVVCPLLAKIFFLSLLETDCSRLLNLQVSL